MDRLEAWAREGRLDREELAWMVRHALRGLVKAGHPRALRMLGYDPAAEVEVGVDIVPGAVRIGGMLEFEFRVDAPRDTPVLVDCIVHFH